MAGSQDAQEKASYGARTPRKKPVMSWDTQENVRQGDTQETVTELGHPGKCHGIGTPCRKSVMELGHLGRSHPLPMKHKTAGRLKVFMHDIKLHTQF